MKKIYLTFDLEVDLPPYLNTWKSINQIEDILEILKSLNCTATFFVSANLAKKFPKVVYKISKQHEIASHFYNHIRVNKLNFEDKKKLFRKSHQILSKFQKIRGFRAPYFQMDLEGLEILVDMIYKYDSSYPNFKLKKQNIIKEYPPTLSNLIFRIPYNLAVKIIINYLDRVDNMTLFIHPWEFANIRHIHRLDCTLLTGRYLKKNFYQILKKLKSKKIEISSID